MKRKKMLKLIFIILFLLILLYFINSVDTKNYNLINISNNNIILYKVSYFNFRNMNIPFYYKFILYEFNNENIKKNEIIVTLFNKYYSNNIHDVVNNIFNLSKFNVIERYGYIISIKDNNINLYLEEIDDVYSFYYHDRLIEFDISDNYLILYTYNGKFISINIYDIKNRVHIYQQKYGAMKNRYFYIKNNNIYFIQGDDIFIYNNIKRDHKKIKIEYRKLNNIVGIYVDQNDNIIIYNSDIIQIYYKNTSNKIYFNKLYCKKIYYYDDQKVIVLNNKNNLVLYNIKDKEENILFENIKYNIDFNNSYYFITIDGNLLYNKNDEVIQIGNINYRNNQRINVLKFESYLILYLTTFDIEEKYFNEEDTFIIYKNIVEKFKLRKDTFVFDKKIDDLYYLKDEN